MISLITKLLQKRGIKDVNELSPEEKGTFESWEKILSGSEVSVKSISTFCEHNIRTVEAQFKNLDTSKEKLERLVLLHTVYSSLLGIINSPQAEKEALERYLNSLL